MTLAVLLVGCTSLLGLEELDELPEVFPLQIDAPTGKITRASSGQVSTDLVFDEADEARTHWLELRGRAEASGWSVEDEGRQGKRDVVELVGDEGRLQLGCCLQRSDRKHLMFVSWWPAGG